QPWEPRTWQRYGYAYANPISYDDPYGLAVIASNGSNSGTLRLLQPGSIPPVPSFPSKPKGAQWTDQCLPQPWAIQIIIDTQQIAQRIPLSSQTWAQVGTTLDFIAWLTDVWAAGTVAAGTVLGFTGGAIVEGKPIPGGTLAGALAGLWLTELSVRPLLLTGNVLATFATGATIISEAKEEKTRLQMTLTLDSGGLSYEYQLIVGSGSQIAIAMTTLGWLAPEAFTSLLYQSVALGSDVGWVSTPWGSLRFRCQGFVPLAFQQTFDHRTGR
ncbi:MAG: hypothetical protein NZ572_07435, partial [Thermoflexus sp.]|nr:hypothetical protein [Thermoflexus sp.]